MEIRDVYEGKDKFLYVCTERTDVVSLCEKFGMAIGKFMELNALTEPPRAGDTLVFEKTEGLPYAVRPGDSLESISSKFSVNISEINRNNVCHNIYPGLTLYI